MPSNSDSLFWVPIVRSIAASGDDHRAALAKVAVGAPPAAHYVLDRDIGLDFAAIGWLDRNRGEWPALAWLVAPTASHHKTRVEGRSCALGLALASACAHLAVAPTRPVVATGELAGGKVVAVAHLFEKMRAAVALSAGATALPLVLVPKDGLQERIVGNPKLHDMCQALEAQGRFVAVATLEEALAAVSPDHTAVLSSNLMDLREQLELIRLSQREWAEALAPAASALVTAARAQLPNDSAALAMLEVLALAALELAGSAMPLQLEGLPWLQWDAGKPLVPQLATAVDARLHDFAGQLPVEIVATVHNLRAAATLRTFEFGLGLRHADAGLALPNLSRHTTGEFRRLLGTRAQLHARQALRMLSAGLPDEARSHAQAGLQDAIAALAAAPSAMEPNDRARVVVYAMFAETAAYQVGLAPSLALHAELAAAEASQGSAGWVRDVRWLALRTGGQWQTLIDEFRSSLASAGDSSLGFGNQDSAPLQACDLRALATMAEAGCRTSDSAVVPFWCARLADRQQQLATPHPLTLARWWPALRSLSQVKRSKLLEWMTAWADGDLTILPAQSLAPGLLSDLAHRWQVAAWQRDWRTADALRDRVLLWYGEPTGHDVPEPTHELSYGPKAYRFARGKTCDLAQLPTMGIALDGAVIGPQLDHANKRYSFDHHGNSIRHATLSTCEMVRDALRVGFDAEWSTVMLNDLDVDSVLAAWLLRRPAAASDSAVCTAISMAGRRDALGPTAGYRVPPALLWALEPALANASTDDELRQLQASFDRLDAWRSAGAPLLHLDMQPTKQPSTVTTMLHSSGLQGHSGRWAVAMCPGGIAGMASLYQQGYVAGVVGRTLDNGTTEYTIGKRSEFVAGFDVPLLLATLAATELALNPRQSPEHNWGGGSTIGGSPRNTDGTSSRIPPALLFEVIKTRV